MMPALRACATAPRRSLGVCSSSLCAQQGLTPEQVAELESRRGPTVAGNRESAVESKEWRREENHRKGLQRPGGMSRSPGREENQAV